MKTGIHPEVFETTVHCNGCNTTFTTHTTVKDITVEICSNCHPFYTGKQKLVDTAGRVDKFKARQAAATKHAESKAAKTKKASPKTDQKPEATDQVTVAETDAPAAEA